MNSLSSTKTEPTPAPNAATSLKLDWATHAAARHACEKWHYSHSIPASKLVKIGVWEGGAFVGVVIFGVGATRSLVKRFGLRPEQGCELVRVALREHKTSVTRIVSIAIRMLLGKCPLLKLIVSFADPEHGHVGGIYQGGNWIYTGKSAAADEYIFRGRRWQGRGFRSSFGRGREHDPGVVIVKGSSKYRYVMPLNAETRAAIEKFCLPYPKRGSQSTGGAAPTLTLQKN